MKACDPESPEQQSQILQKLKERNISNSMLSNLPFWVQKFCFLVSEFIHFENEQMPKDLSQKYANYTGFTQQDIENEAYGIKQQRMQNIAVTVDKIAYVLRMQSTKMKSTQPPLRRLSKMEILDRIWNDEHSLINILLRCIRIHEYAFIINEIEEIIKNNGEQLRDYNLLQPKMLSIRDRLRQIASTPSCYFDAAADLIHLYAHTKCFFVHNQYDSVKSAPFTLSELGFNLNESKFAKIANIKCQKPYGPNYIWGQMTFWHKQDVEKPDLSLSHRRKGCIYLPQIQSCFAKKANASIIKSYDEETRDFFLQSLMESPHSSWSNSLHWTFKEMRGTQRMYGSPFLDKYLDESIDLVSIIQELQQCVY